MSSYLYSAMGLAGLAAIFSIVLNGKKLAVGFSQGFFSTIRHDQHLGLQATVGMDLRALLFGWMPGDCLRRANTGEGVITKFGVTFYFVSIVLVYVVLWYRNWFSEGAKLWYAIAMSMSFAAIYSLIWWMLSGRLVKKLTQRVLLYIDDLDRCDPIKMLEVIEGLMQFLESSEIRDRLQIVMLVDHAVLTSAILKKYSGLADMKPTHSVPNQRQIVIENIEKLFIGYLILPSLNEADLGEVVDRHIEELKKKGRIGEPTETDKKTEDAMAEIPSVKRGLESGIGRDGAIPSSKISTQLTSGSTEIPSVLTTPSEEFDKKQEQVYETVTTVTYSHAEAIVLSKKLRNLGQSGTTRPGPRSVRGIMFRYQLARDMLVRMREVDRNIWSMQDADDLIDAIMSADSSRPLPDTGDIADVAKLVSISIS